jgi:hypothetical protein
MAREAKEASEGLLGGLLQMMKTWVGLSSALGAQQIRSLDAKRAELEERAASTTDPVAREHLNRASQALRAQGRAAEGLKTGQARAEAMVDAQAALLGRLHMTMLRQKATESELLAHEVGDVAEEAAILFDEVDEMAATLERLNQTGGASFSEERSGADETDEPEQAPAEKPRALLPKPRIKVIPVEAVVIEEELPG